MERHRRAERTRTRRRRQGGLTRALLALSGIIIACGALSRLFPGSELTATVVATPAPTLPTAAFDETVQTRELGCPAETWWCIQSGIFGSEGGAVEKSAAYTDRGAPGFVLRDGEKWRVLLGAYEEKQDAQTVRDRLKSDQAVETFVHGLTCPALPVRLTGMAGQLDVLEAALTLLPELTRQLRDTAAGLDAKELTLGEGRTRLNTWAEQLATLTEVLDARFVPPEAPLVTGVRQVCAALTEAIRAAKKAESTAALLSAELKMGALKTFAKRKAVWETILAG